MKALRKHKEGVIKEEIAYLTGAVKLYKVYIGRVEQSPVHLGNEWAWGSLLDYVSSPSLVRLSPSRRFIGVSNHGQSRTPEFEIIRQLKAKSILVYLTDLPTFLTSGS